MRTLLAGVVLVAFLIWPSQTVLAVFVIAVVVVWAKNQRVVRHGNVTPLAATAEALRAENCVHEAGHYVISKNRGYGVSSQVLPNGRGWTAVSPRNAMDDAVILAAGSEAANAFYHRRDAGITRGDASLLPDACRRARITVAQAREIARNEVRASRAAIERAARRLDERGRI